MIDMICKPYFSIDIETTGLDIERARLVELAIVYDDLNSKIEDLPRLQLLAKPKIDYCEFYAMGMNIYLLKLLSETENFSEALFQDQIDRFFSIQNPAEIILAGKNLASFDLPILKNNGYKLPKYSHRIMDVGSMYYSKFGYVPSLNEINTLIKYRPVSHRALEDALNVVVAIRATLNM